MLRKPIFMRFPEHIFGGIRMLLTLIPFAAPSIAAKAVAFAETSFFPLFLFTKQKKQGHQSGESD